MKIQVNIKELSLEVNGERCSFHEAGLYVNVDGDFSPITDKSEISDFLEGKFPDAEIIFE